MGLMDNMKDQAGDIMNDPDKKEQVERMAKEKGISVDQAKEHFTKQSDND